MGNCDDGHWRYGSLVGSENAAIEAITNRGWWIWLYGVVTSWVAYKAESGEKKKKEGKIEYIEQRNWNGDVLAVNQKRARKG